MTNFASGASTLLAGNEAMTSMLMVPRTVRGFGRLCLLGAVFLMQAAAQSHISLDIERQFNGNLLTFSVDVVHGVNTPQRPPGVSV